MTPKLDGKISMAELRAFYPALAAVAEHGLRNPIDPAEAAWLDGPSFARWLRRNGLDPLNKLGDTVKRQVLRWAEGDAVNLGTADTILTDLGHHLDDLPDSTWRDRPKNAKRPRITGAAKQEILRRYANGEGTPTLAEEYAIPAGTIRRWASEAETERRVRSFRRSGESP